MAYITSDDYKKQLYQKGERIYKCELTIDGVLVPMSQIKKIEISSPIIDDESDYFHIGTFISQQLTITFKNLDGLNIRTGIEVLLSISLQITDDTYETIPIGAYLIDNLDEDYQQTNEIVCLDYGSKALSNCDFSGIYTDTKKTATYLEILQYICDKYGYELGTYPTINNDVETSQYDSTLSGKAWISYIAEVFGGNVKIGREKSNSKPVLNIIPLKNDSVMEIDATTYKSLSFGEHYKISKVTYDNVGTLYQNGDDTGNNLFLRNSNPLINSQMVVDNIATTVIGFETYSVEAELFGDISLDCWDCITLKVDDNSYPILNNNTITYAISILSKISSKIPTLQQEITTNVYGGDIEDKVSRVYTQVDNINHKIDLVSADTYTKKEVQEIANGTSSEVEVSYVANEMGSFTQDGFRISKENESGEIISDTTTLFNEVGMNVQKVENGLATDSILFAGYVDEDNEDYKEDYLGQSIVGTENVVVKDFAVFGEYSRIQDFTQNGINKTGMFPIGR